MSSRIATRAIFGSLEVGALFVALVAVFNAFGPGRDDFTWVFALSLVFAVDQTVLAVSANLRKLVKEGAPVLPWHLWMKAPKRRSFSKSWSRNLFWFTYAGLIIGAVLVGITIWKWPRSHPGAAQAAPPPPPLGTNPPLYTSRTHSPPMPAPGMWEFIFWIGSVARIVWNLNNLMRDLQKDEELH